jgi:branched-chain amino acid transport system ATP-binding protein
VRGVELADCGHFVPEEKPERLADELSLGLAPKLVARLLLAVRETADQHGTGVLLVEQQVRKALRYVDRVYVMCRGSIAMACEAQEAVSRLAEIEERISHGTADAWGYDAGRLERYR